MEGLLGPLQVVVEAQGPQALNAKDGRNGMTPLMYAASMGHMAVVRWLCARGADCAARTARGKRAAEFARESKHPEIHRFLAGPALLRESSGCVS